jgi:hypothetical protein
MTSREALYTVVSVYIACILGTSLYLNHRKKREENTTGDNEKLRGSEHFRSSVEDGDFQP